MSLDATTADATLAQTQRRIEALVQQQCAASERDRTPQDKAHRGDERARSLILSLLPYDRQRTVFLNMIANGSGATTTTVEHALSRARHLFGAPPYPFLLGGDAHLLNAKGFCPSRANMSLGDMTYGQPNKNQFGLLQYTDSMRRTYRYLQPDRTPDSAPTSVAALALKPLMSAFEMHVRVDRRRASPASRKRARSDGDGASADAPASMAFPHAGETLHLRLNAELASWLGLPKEHPCGQLTLRVTAIRFGRFDSRAPPCSGALPATAVVLVQLMARHPASAS